MIKVPDWRTWAYTDGSCHIKHGKREIGAGVYSPLTGSKNDVEPNGAGITNTICRAELAASAAAITHSYSHIASGSLTSLHQIRKQLITLRNAVAKHQANQANNSMADTEIPGTGPGGNPFFHLFWPRRKKENRLPAHPHILHPILKSPTSQIFKMPSSLTCIRNTDRHVTEP
eukprot:1138093-Pelagomonas_calceolata.AAC.1